MWPNINDCTIRLHEASCVKLASHLARTNDPSKTQNRAGSTQLACCLLSHNIDDFLGVF